MHNDQTTCGSTSWHGTVPHTITTCRSLWSTYWPLQDIKVKHCSEYIFHTICCRITKLGVVVHHGMVQCRSP